MSAPRLSIIVPCFNEADGIAESLEALAPFRRRGAQTIVVDGGSTDGTFAQVYGRADLAMSAPRGRALQMNAGARFATGDVLLFLHADTRLPDAADRLIHDGLSASGRNWGRFDVRIRGRRALFPLIAATMNLRSRWSGIATGDQAIFVRRAVFERIGGYPVIALMEDVALTERLKRESRPLCIARPAVTSGRRWEKHGVLRTVFLMWRLRLAYRLGADPDALALRYVAHK